MASPSALPVLGLLLAALLYGSSLALTGEQATVKKAGQQHSTVTAAAGEGNAVKYYADHKGSVVAAAAEMTSEVKGNNDGIGTDGDGFCNCCSYFRRRCARLCCADGRQIPL